MDKLSEEEWEKMGQTAPHGGDVYRNRVEIDFSVNTNPCGIRPEVMRAIRESADRIDVYPDIYCEALVNEIGKYEGVPKERIFCGNGAAEIFFALVLALKPKKALLVSPTFSEYANALRVTGTDITYYELLEEQDFQIREDLLDQITDSIDVVFLCNPNNPTGQAMTATDVERIAGKCRAVGTILVVDECFVDFLDETDRYSIKGKLSEYPNIVLVKAFTKLFCMPGVRLGYAVSYHSDLLREMATKVQPWNVSILAQAAGCAAMKDCKEYIHKTGELVRKERSFLKESLQRCGFQVYGSLANYIFFRDRSLENNLCDRERKEDFHRKDLYQKALEAGFLIRDCSNYRGLSKGYYRIAVKTRTENVRLMEWLRQL